MSDRRRTGIRQFSDFFSRLSSGVQLQSLFLAQPNLFELIVQVMAFAPRLASTLARRPAAIDAMLDGAFFEAIDMAEDGAFMRAAVARAAGFEGAMDAVRIVHREQAFRVGVQVISGSASAVVAGKAFADLADLCVDALALAALAETERLGSAFAGRRGGGPRSASASSSREMSAPARHGLVTLAALPTRWAHRAEELGRRPSSAASPGWLIAAALRPGPARASACRRSTSTSPPSNCQGAGGDELQGLRGLL